MQISHGVQADVTESLNDESFSTPTGRRSNHAHVIRLVNKVLQTVENAPTGGGNSTVDTTLVNRFTSDASVTVDVVETDGFGVSVGDPGHFPFSSTHIRSRDVDARALKYKSWSVLEGFF